MKRFFVISLLLFFIGTGCGHSSSVTGTQIVGKVKVTQAGGITFNGKSLTLEDLKVELNRLKQAEGAVEYYRESADGEPSEKAMEVFGAIMESGLPIKLSDKE